MDSRTKLRKRTLGTCAKLSSEEFAVDMLSMFEIGLVAQLVRAHA